MLAFLLLLAKGWLHQDATWRGGRPQPRRLCVRWGPSFPSPKGAQLPPNFRPMSVVVKRLHGLRWHLVLGSGDFVFDGHPATPTTEGTSATSQFLAHVSCGQTAGWMKTPLGMEVDLSPGHFVLDGFPAVCERGTAAPLHSAHAYCVHGRPSQLLLSSCRNYLKAYSTGNL